MTAPAARLRAAPGSGRLLIHTRREGFAARVGHDLTIEVTRWSAEITRGAGDLAASTVHATIEFDSLRAVEGTGGAAPLTSRDRAEIEANARRVLGHATATFVSTRIIPDGDGSGGGDGGTIEGTLSLNGVSRPVRVAVTAGDGARYRGRATIVQSDFGIRPYTAFLGALKLRDEVEVEVEVDLDRAEPLGDAPANG